MEVRVTKRIRIDGLVAPVPVVYPHASNRGLDGLEEVRIAKKRQDLVAGGGPKATLHGSSTVVAVVLSTTETRWPVEQSPVEMVALLDASRRTISEKSVVIMAQRSAVAV